jgi:hypothetical protein
MRKLIIFLLFISLSSQAQIPVIKWQQCFGSPDIDMSNGIVAMNDGLLFAIHLRDSIPGITNYHGMGDIWVVKTDNTGNIIWEKCFGGSKGDVPQKLIKKSEDEYFIYGYTYSTDGDVQSGNHGHSDVWVVKINRQGDILWENTYGCTGIDDPRDMILTPDGGFVMIDRIGIGGGDVTHFYGIGDCWMAKCDSLGNLEWEKTLGNAGLDNCVSMIVNSVGNIMMIGAAQWHGGLVECYPDGAWGDVWIVELDLQGNILAQYCYGGSHYDLGYSIIELEDGFAYIAFTVSNDGDISGLHGPPDLFSDIWVVRLDDQMEIVWQKCLGGYDSDFPIYITQTGDGGFVVIGMVISDDGDVSGNHSIDDNYGDIWVVKLDGEGELLWQQCYGGKWAERLENPHTVLKKSDYNYVFAASSNFSPSFDVQCGTFHNYNAWLFEIALEDTTRIINPVANRQSINIFPNPATTEAWLQLPESINLTQVHIELYSPTGSLLLRTKPESNFYRIETALLPPGLYVVRLWDGKGWKSGRFVVK